VGEARDGHGVAELVGHVGVVADGEPGEQVGAVTRESGGGRAEGVAHAAGPGDRGGRVAEMRQVSVREEQELTGFPRRKRRERAAGTHQAADLQSSGCLGIDGREDERGRAGRHDATAELEALEGCLDHHACGRGVNRGIVRRRSEAGGSGLVDRAGDGEHGGTHAWALQIETLRMAEVPECEERRADEGRGGDGQGERREHRPPQGGRSAFPRQTDERQHEGRCPGCSGRGCREVREADEDESAEPGGHSGARQPQIRRRVTS
jgi:hypothetical protein